MRAVRTAEQALRLAGAQSKQQYVCRACRIQAARQFSTSSSRPADIPFYKRIQQTLFGSKEQKDAEESRGEKQRRKIEELAQQNVAEQELKTDKHGRQYEVAAVVDPTINKDYVQATTWDGLESIGSEAWVKSRADNGEQYVGFVPRKRVELNDKQWEMLLHHVTVEALALQKAGRNAGQICNARTGGSNSWLHTKGATIQRAVDGDVTVNFAQAGAELQILEAIPVTPKGQAQDEQALFKEVEGAVVEGQLAQESKEQGCPSPDWMDFSLQDPGLKMAILKRTLQLTGKRLPDPAVSSSTTLADLYDGFKIKETPNKLTLSPKIQRLRLQAPNVTVHARRQTPIDKEKLIGRWKIIEEELRRRDLPVTGSRWQDAKAEVR